MNLYKRIPLVAFQTALYTLLKSYGQTVPVYDDVPANAKLPFITLGGFTSKQVGSKTTNCWDISQQIHLWSDYHGKKEVNQMADDVSSLITAYKLNLATAGFDVTSQDVDFFEAFEEEEGGYSGVVTFVARIQDLGGN